VALQVLIVPDKFKGTLTALEAARCIAAGWKRKRPADRLTLLPMSDGGDGFGEMMGFSLGARAQTLATVDAAQRRCRARWWWDARTRTAVIEAARIHGLAMLPPGRFHPFDLDTSGLGAALQAAARKGARRCLIGIGGSATNDAGFGLARALGWRFLDQEGHAIERWTALETLHRVEQPGESLKLGEVVVAVDVQNPLLGARGCTRVYGPQKGLRPADFARAERCLRRLAQVVDKGGELAAVPGAGAAGGLGFGLMAFVGARLEPGFDLFARHARLEARLRAAELVITGEGAIDRSTLMGKGVGELAAHCRRRKLPCLGLAGVVPDERLAAQCFTLVAGIVPGLAEADSAIARPKPLLTRLAALMAERWSEMHG
jgi:glycerate 2-kinase